MKSILPLAALCAASMASAARLTVSIPPSQLLPNPSALPPSTHAVLLGPAGVRYDIPIRRDNSFAFPDLPPSSYLLTVHSRDYFFPPLRVDMSKTAAEEGTEELVQAWQTFRGNEWDNKGPIYGSGKGSLTVNVQPNAKKDFYQPRGGFSLLGFLKSPMILMALVSVVFIFGLPYLMENSMSRTLLRICSSYANAIQQWTPRPKRNSRRCRRKARSWALAEQPTSCRTLTWLASWQAGDRQARTPGQVAAGTNGGKETKNMTFCPPEHAICAARHSTCVPSTPGYAVHVT
jgi:ER membrane protein complex subunit 7